MSIVQTLKKLNLGNTTAPLLLLLLFFSIGCGMRAENVTADSSGRRAGKCDAAGGYVAYVWHPAQLKSTQGHLVLLDQVAKVETELQSDFSGPWAMCDGRVLWWNSQLRDEEGKTDITAFDIASGQKSALARTKVQDLEADGDSVIWDEPAERGSNVVLYDFKTGQQRVIGRPAAEGETIYHRNLKFGSGTAAWEAANRTTKKTTIETYDVASGKLASLAIPQELAPMDVSGNRLVYSLKNGDIHLYDIEGGTDTVIASVERLAGPPSIEGSRIAWCEYVTKDRFKGIPGQPLFNEKDICDVFLFDLDSGKKRRVAEYLLSNGHVSLHGGRVYLSVYREYPPPGASNMVVPVDLWVW